ncbi:MAG: GNAT family N-acetyltransferase [Alphaproteobacteria bacterium]|nr:GNAT family N-acetyltransferase [Alphaproteobacteria bacterium]
MRCASARSPCASARRRRSSVAAAAVTVEALDADPKTVRGALPDLAAVLADCVAGGASVGFMEGFGVAEAALYFKRVFEDVADGKVVLLAARQGKKIVGTVQLGLEMMPNQPHRAEVKKLLVHRSARGAGIGERLMGDVERFARHHDRTLLVLDTANATAERLYSRLGWVRVGVIPDYALLPNGDFCDTTLFFKRIGS